MKPSTMSDGEKLVKRRIDESVRAKLRISQKLMRDIALAADRIVESYARGGKLILFGNGGSAADAQHIACEMVGRFLVERRSLEAVALGMNVSTLTAIGNDYGYDRVFDRELESTARPEDVVVAISTSGDSPNVLRAVRRAKKIGCATIAMTGQSAGKLKGEADITLNVPSKGPSPRIQELHILVGHIICELVERGVGGKKK